MVRLATGLEGLSFGASVVFSSAAIRATSTGSATAAGGGGAQDRGAGGGGAGGGGGGGAQDRGNRSPGSIVGSYQGCYN